MQFPPAPLSRPSWREISFLSKRSNALLPSRLKGENPSAFQYFSKSCASMEADGIVQTPEGAECLDLQLPPEHFCAGIHNLHYLSSRCPHTLNRPGVIAITRRGGCKNCISSTSGNRSWPLGLYSFAGGPQSPGYESCPTIPLA